MTNRQKWAHRVGTLVILINIVWIVVDLVRYISYGH